jgi:hypothetical protein
MRKPAILLLFFILPALLLCVERESESEKDETLISGKIEHGGFGGPVLKFSSIGDKFAFIVGGRGGWIINHALSLGGGGYGLAQESVFEGVPGSAYMEFGYGGAIIEYVYRSKKLMHVTLAGLIGAGGFGYAYRDFRYYREEVDAFFVMEPEINIMMNVTDCFRMGVGGSYRYVSGVSIADYTNADLSGFSAHITMKFGIF